MDLIFSKIKRGNIFVGEFEDLTENNTITFSRNERIAVIYGPNGTGKSSLIKVLEGNEENTDIDFTWNEQNYEDGREVFHIINDQNSRNIIEGNEQEFLLGDNIRREFELQYLLESDKKNIIEEIIKKLKNDFGIKAKNSPLINLVQDEDLKNLIEECANSKSKASQYTADKLIEIKNNLHVQDVGNYERSKIEFIIEDAKDGIIERIRELLGTELEPRDHIKEIEENDVAIDVLNRFIKEQCIVCDREINRTELLQNKTNNRECILNDLGDLIKEIVEHILNIIPMNDPFNIKQILLDSLENGDIRAIESLYTELHQYQLIYGGLLNNMILDELLKDDFLAHYNEYRNILSQEPQISDEDLIFIQEIISGSMNKPLTVERDSDNRLKICLNNQEFLGTTREQLPLSSGEQNFLSLTFEFLKAKNSNKPIIVIDDPISSFDSIYKNKVAYAIIKILHSKNCIILTHNIDLIRLLQSQYRNCFELYLLNNTEGEENGFIHVNNNEKEILISIEKLLCLFRNNIYSHINDNKLFLMSVIPFMRGYSNIIGNHGIYEELTKVMHGYNTEEVDIGHIYMQLFGEHAETFGTQSISVADILNSNIDDINILDESYPLLNKALRHALIYLFLRLYIERSLVNRFPNIDVTQERQLGQIVNEAYPEGESLEQNKKRIRLISKKTLINEFNHFEGNLSIFQPAIDINESILNREKEDILSFIEELQNE